MCIMSQVYDHYDRVIPIYPTTVPWQQPPTIIFPFVDNGIVEPETDEDPWEKFKDALLDLIDQFREDVEDAKRLDSTLGQPDCVDPKKAELEDRVRALEEALLARG